MLFFFPALKTDLIPLQLTGPYINVSKHFDDPLTGNVLVLQSVKQLGDFLCW